MDTVGPACSAKPVCNSVIDKGWELVVMMAVALVCCKERQKLAVTVSLALWSCGVLLIFESRTSEIWRSDIIIWGGIETILLSEAELSESAKQEHVDSPGHKKLFWIKIGWALLCERMIKGVHDINSSSAIQFGERQASQLAVCTWISWRIW